MVSTISNKNQGGAKKGKQLKSAAPEGSHAREKETGAAVNKSFLSRARSKVAARETSRKEKINFFDQARKYFQGVMTELKKVRWPGRKEVTVYTLVVLLTVAVIGILIWIFDLVLRLVLNFAK